MLIIIIIISLLYTDAR